MYIFTYIYTYICDIYIYRYGIMMAEMTGFLLVTNHRYTHIHIDVYIDIHECDIRIYTLMSI
jgi:hypothetical protein